LLQCPELVKNLSYIEGRTSTLNENFVYGSLKQQEMIVKIYSDILYVRENLQHKSNLNFSRNVPRGLLLPHVEGPMHLVYCVPVPAGDVH
jgi:hypothetical protein